MTRRISADPRGLILPRHPHMLAVANWLTSSSKHEQTKAELRRMPAEAVRNTQPAVEHGPKRSPKAKKRARLERFPAKWIPVRVKKTHQNKEIERPFGFNRNGKSSGLPYSVDQALAELGSRRVQVRRRGNMSTRRFLPQKDAEEWASISSGGSIARARIRIGCMEGLIEFSFQSSARIR